MTATIIIRNLSDELDEPDLRQRLSETLKIEQMELVPDKGAGMTSRQAIVKVDMPLFEADELAQRWNGRIVGGRELRVTTMRFME
jgi:hypothetical protein